MKQLATAYSYAPVQRTVTLTGLNVPLGYILLVVNATRGQIIYNLADPLLAAASYLRAEDSVLTLNSSVDTSLHSASDDLTIFYDNGAESQMVLVQGPAGPQGIPGTTSWLGITDKPESFPASEHTHLKSEITGLDADLADLSAADTALGQRIDSALANLDPAAIDSIAEAVTTINTERTERIAADEALQAAIDGKAPASHTHTASQITDFATAVVAVSPPVDWSSLTGKPSTFAPSAHTHAQSEITGLTDALAAKATVTSVNQVTTDLATEQSARIAGDSALSARIDYLTENLDPTVIDSIAEAADSLNNLQTQLDTHQHTAADITDFASAVVASAPGLSITSTIRIADGVSATFPIDGLVSNDPESVLVALNGVTQAPGTDYTVSEASGTITFDSAPAAGTQIAATALGLRSVQPPIDPTLYLFAFDSTTDGLTTYSGRLLNADRPAAPALPETATTWTINRATLTAAGRVLTTASATGSWSNRESLSFQ